MIEHTEGRVAAEQRPGAKVWDATAFGAVADGRAPATAAIQRVIDVAGEQGGGRVVLPAGRYRCGTLHLRSHVTLELATGAVLQASRDLADYAPSRRGKDGDRHPYHFIVAEGLENVRLCGGGTIDGQGEAFWHAAMPNTWKRGGARDARPSPMIEVVDCRDVHLHDVSIVNAAGWTLHLHRCDAVVVNGVRIDNDLFGPNTDGIDINGCHDVCISNCNIRCGDDAIVLKTTEDSRSLERVTVTNCTLRTNCVALKLGAAESYHPMRQVTFSNCVAHASHRVVGLYNLRGTTFEDIMISNIACDTLAGLPLQRPIHIDLRRKDDNDPPGTIRNVSISNFTTRTTGRCLLTAEAGCRLENVTLRDVMVTMPEVEDPAPLAAEARSVQFSNRSPEARAARAAVVAENVHRLVIDNLHVSLPEAGAEFDFPLLWGRGLVDGRVSGASITPEPAGESRYDLQACSIDVSEAATAKRALK
ncbi:MAG: glycosyl hydrolase family 28 protein [Phycisphaeraceae bacterium]